MKKLLVAAIMVVLATPAFAAIQNVKVSGDITTSWLDDSNLDLGANAVQPGFGSVATGLKSQNVFLTQTRLRVDADLSDNVSTTVGLINERAWNAENGPATSALDTNVQLYLASVTLRELLYSPLTVTVGRQVFNYGNGLIMGDGGPVNFASGNLGGIYADLTERTSYDGVKATLDYKPLTIDLLYFKNGQTLSSIAGLGHQTSGDSSDVYGYNASYQLSDPYNTVIEQYFFSRVNGAGFGSPTTLSGIANTSNPGADKADTLYVPGLRASTNPIKGLNVQGEVAWELGNVEISNPNGNSGQSASEHRSAFAAQFLTSYALPVLEKYKPTVNAGYTYVSGDKNANANYIGDPIKSTKTYSAWDEFNTIQGAGTIYRAIFPLSNESIVSVGASVNPLEDVTAAVTWSGLWSAVRTDSSQNPLVVIDPASGALQQEVGNKNGYWLGNETDVNLTYNYTEDVTFGLNLGWFVPGDVFSKANDETASQAIANIGVKF